MVRSIGADHVIDYTQEDFTEGRPRYDFILDNVRQPLAVATRGARSPRRARWSPNGGETGDRWLAGGDARSGRTLLSLFVGQSSAR